MAVVAAPSLVIPVAAPASLPALTLQVGQVVDAVVLKLIGDTKAQLAIANTVIEVATTTPLTLGASLRLAVEGRADALKLVIQPALENGGGEGVRSGGPTINAGAPADAVRTDSSTRIAAAPTDSVANVARTANAPLTIPAAVSPEQAALAETVERAAARQNSLAPLLANVEVVASHDALPPDVKAAAARLLNLRPALTEDLSGVDVKAGLSRSGLFLEARLAVVARAGEAGVNVALPDDLKAALLSLRQALSGFVALTGEGEGQASAIQVAAGVSAKAETATPNPSTISASPPFRGSETSAQAVATPGIALSDEASGAARVVLADTDAALARQTLMQAASLPDAQSAGQPDRSHAGSGPNWAFEIPFATPQGTAMAQFEVSRDGGRGSADASNATWRAKFSLDIEPIGPVHAQIAISGTRTAVTLWAERHESAAALRDNASLLTEGLRTAELEHGDLLVREGAPPKARAVAGHFLDRAS